MQSDTKPLPAATLLALCDEVIYAVESHALQVPEKIAAYRAARAASPVTLEEALMVAERHAYHRAGSGRYFDPDMLDDWRIATGALIQHARRLAGEGGGQ